MAAEEARIAKRKTVFAEIEAGYGRRKDCTALVKLGQKPVDLIVWELVSSEDGFYHVSLFAQNFDAAFEDVCNISPTAIPVTSEKLRGAFSKASEHPLPELELLRDLALD
ncbi:MAG: hypothetical protein ACU0A6_12670 [Shimia sp.]|uniref:hypothetical protein n=1 Tax=Shimia sp. TaxID=1954381 RepID=UPI00405984E0